MKIVSLVGARPQFIKEAIVNREVRRRGAWHHVLVHSGQHYDINMSDVFFRQLEIPRPDHFLGVGSGLHGRQTAEALTRFEAVLLEEKPDAVLVYGDTNTTLAGALAAAKLHIPVVHVEAGLRQSPKTMPEEINRVLTDHISTRLFCCSDLGATNLKEEGITEGIEVVGDVMYDLYLEMAPSFDAEKALRTQGLREKGFLVVTLHRDFNVDSRESLQEILQGLNLAREETGLEVFLPLHPRTAKRIDEFGLKEETKPLRLAEPLGYLELMALVRASAAVVTDSGGLQKEAYFAGKRAVVVMPDTAWRELTQSGWNSLSEAKADALARHIKKALSPLEHPGDLYGTGQAAAAIVGAIANQRSLS